MTEHLNKVREASAKLKVDDDTVYKLIKNGALRAIRVGRNWRIPDSAITDFIERGGART